MKTRRTAESGERCFKKMGNERNLKANLEK